MWKKQISMLKTAESAVEKSVETVEKTCSE
jgi:hypothetical protein